MRAIYHVGTALVHKCIGNKNADTAHARKCSVNKNIWVTERPIKGRIKHETASVLFLSLLREDIDGKWIDARIVVCHATATSAAYAVTVQNVNNMEDVYGKVCSPKGTTHATHA